MEDKERVAAGNNAGRGEAGDYDTGTAETKTAGKSVEPSEPESSPETAPKEPVDIDELKRQMAEQTARAEDYFQRLVRLQADFENYRKRVQREKEELLKFSGEHVVTAILPVLDNLERALAVKEHDPSQVVAGVEMIYRQLQDILSKEGLTPIKAVGEQFDPSYHEAVMQEESTTARDNTVLEEFCRGYCFKERLIRPSMVKVARAVKKEQGKEQASETQEVEK